MVETLIKDYPGNPDHAPALEDVRKELAELDQAISQQKAEPSPNSGPETEVPKTEPQKEETEELPKSSSTSKPANEEGQTK